LSKDELKWQFYLADNIGELIAAAPRLSSPPSREIIASKITNCINQITLGDTAKFASLVGLPGISVGAYRKGNSLPGIDKLLKICYCLEISLLNFLTKEVSTALCLPKVVAIPNKRRRKPYNKPCVQLHKNLEQVRQKMQAALEEEPPPSLTQMAQRFGCSTTVILSKHLPDLSNQIKVRYRDYQKDCLRQKNVIALEAVLKQEPPPTLEEVAIRLGYADTGNALYTQFPFLIAQIVKRSKDYRKACAQERLERADVEVWQAALELHSQGKKPTDETVKLILKKPGLMRSQKARKTLQKFRQEYGYEK
jgi:transcriptional regulator with XRE-family HTH domain